jgi:mRNA interferase MazF
MPRNYVPDSGDVVWLEFDPQAGRKQTGHRPALVISPASYNGRVGLAVCCPVTTRIKGYPFEVAVQSGSTPCVVLSDQMKSLDWQQRQAKFKSKVTAAQLDQVKQHIKVLLEMNA